MIANAFNNLTKDPIFNMSLHSKELFHSNFWAWLFDHNHEYVKIFFPDLGEHDSVEREQKNRDITIWSNGIAYIIENKIKALPEHSQIKRYEAGLGDSFSKGVITGIIKPDFISIENRWSFMSYSEISNGIMAVAEKIEKSGFDKDLICKYAEMLKSLSTVIIDSVGSMSGKWVSSFDFSELQRIRMDDIVKKLIASEFCSYISDRINDSKIRFNIDDYELHIESGYSHKHAIVDIRYVQTVKKNNISVIGIQIEDGEYRLCVQMNKNLDDEKKEKLFNEYVKLGWFENYNKKTKLIKEHKTSLSKQFCQYSTRDYAFLYQYWNIDNAGYEHLVSYIIQDITSAANLIDMVYGEK